ncbi:hypothetical protein AMJ57_05245 [Parcubacteria bacterium SG8_24]|nr:MAG: hypothetical protein AMJ57_05245 [Parcubacteria bacterium SG8_24]
MALYVRNDTTAKVYLAVFPGSGLKEDYVLSLSLSPPTGTEQALFTGEVTKLLPTLVRGVSAGAKIRLVNQDRLMVGIKNKPPSDRYLIITGFVN